MLANILLLVINAAAGFITLMLLARFYMQWQRISFRNQLGQFVVSTTDWIVRPLRRFIPGVFGLDMASLLPAWVVQVLLVMIELSLRGAVFSGNTAAVLGGLLGVGLIELIRGLAGEEEFALAGAEADGLDDGGVEKEGVVIAQAEEAVGDRLLQAATHQQLHFNLYHSVARCARDIKHKRSWQRDI